MWLKASGRYKILKKSTADEGAKPQWGQGVVEV